MGDADGLLVGSLVGSPVGDSVGVDEGAADGAAVGGAVPHAPHAPGHVEVAAPQDERDRQKRGSGSPKQWKHVEHVPGQDSRTVELAHSASRQEPGSGTPKHDRNVGAALGVAVGTDVGLAVGSLVGAKDEHALHLAGHAAVTPPAEHKIDGRRQKRSSRRAP